MKPTKQYCDRAPLFHWVHVAVKAAGGSTRVATLLGVTRRTVVYWLAEDYLPPLELALYLAELSGVPLPAHTPLTEDNHGN